MDSRQPVTRGQMLIGRDAECDQIAGLLTDARRGHSGTLLLFGEPGVGKTALCTWALEQANGMRVLTARGVESEIGISYAGLAELCADDLTDKDRLPEPQARAVDAALARRDARQVDRFAIGAAVLSLLSAAAEHEPVLVVVDDAQWLDPSSGQALLFAVRRLRNVGIAVLVATRPGATFDSERTGLTQLRLQGLDAAASRALLHAAHGTLVPGVSDLLASRTEGNPLALLEIPLVLSEAQLAGRQAIAEPLPVGPALIRALLHRLAGLPPDTMRALVVAAATGGERVQPLVDALSTLRLDRSVLEPAEQAGALAITGSHFEFRHPLLRSAIYHGASGPARREVHGALARVTQGEPHAWHLAHATIGEDEAVAATLERIGLDARRRGAPTPPPQLWNARRIFPGRARRASDASPKRRATPTSRDARRPRSVCSTTRSTGRSMPSSTLTCSTCVGGSSWSAAASTRPTGCS